MIKTERMSKLVIVGPKTVMESVIDKLHSMKICHVVDHKKTDELDIGSPMEKSADISEALVKIRALGSSLGIDLAGQSGKIPGRRLDAKRVSSIRKKVENIHERLEKSSEKLKLADEGIQKIEDDLSLLEKLNILGLDPDSFSEYASISYIFGAMEGVKDISQLKKELNKKTSRYRLYTEDYEGETLIAVFFDVNKSNEIMETLSKNGFSEISISSVKGLKGNTGKLIKSAKAELSKLEKEKREIQKDIEVLKKKNKTFIAEAETALAVEAEKAEAPLRFASTEKAFCINGWIPARKTAKVTKELNLASKEKIYIETKPVRNEEEIPIKLKNPKLIQPFEFFMNMYTLPKYREIDPTFLMFLTFPLFYGFMLGDWGYGLVTLALFLYLRKKVKGDFRMLVSAMVFASISTIIFGLLFGEVFGLEAVMGYELPHILSRAHQINELMIIAVAIGVVHLNIGLLAGFYNELMAHGFKAAFFEKISWIIFEIGAALTAVTYMGILPLRKWVGFAVLALGMISIYKGEGAKGIIELPSIFSQMLSYARLMAVGLASVILATVVNDLAGGLFSSGIIGIVGGTILLVVGHMINIALGLISPFLHSLRLHYVEFFTKFYQGGGMRYVPFGTRQEE